MSRRILVPLDFSEQAQAALSEAARQARAGDTLTLLHVVLPAETAFPHIQPLELTEKAEQTAQSKLEELAAGLSCAGTVEVRVEVGPPAERIVELSQDQDLVVIGTRGRSGLARFLIGSVAERVVRRARCSVLVVKPAS